VAKAQVKIERTAAESARSIVALQALHHGLLERLEETPLEALRPDLERFLDQGRALGRILADHKERLVCQGWLDYWATALIRAGFDTPNANLVAFDPASAPELPEETCPFRGLHIFDREHRDLFFGREA
jgi:hypothetical protein